MKIFVCANPRVEKDLLPLKLLPLLRQRFPEVKIFSVNPNKRFQPEDGSIIISTVFNIGGIFVFEDIKTFCKARFITSDNFDLGSQLTLLKNLGHLSKVKIIGIPPFLDLQEAFLETSLLIQKLI